VNRFRTPYVLNHDWVLLLVALYGAILALMALWALATVISRALAPGPTERGEVSKDEHAAPSGAGERVQARPTGGWRGRER
jgi:hypothetical protein